MGKKIMKGMLKEGLMLTAGSAAMSAMPSNDISPHVTKGMASYASFYPARGAMAGMKMHMGGLRSLHGKQRNPLKGIRKRGKLK